MQNIHDDRVLKEIKQILEQTNTLTDQVMSGPVKNAAENVMDVTVIKMAHDLVGQAVACIEHNQFDEDIFANAIVSFKVFFHRSELISFGYFLQSEAVRTDNGAIDWDRFITEVLPTDHHFRCVSTLLATVPENAAPKTKKERIMRQKAAVVNMKMPENVEKLEKNEKGTQILEYVMQTVIEECRERGVEIPYYELIIDSEDYMTTVDNAFQVAFLARDGVLSVKQNENGILCVSVVDDRQKMAAKKITNTNQAVATVDVNEWMQIAERYRDCEPILKMNRADLIPDLGAGPSTSKD